MNRGYTLVEVVVAMLLSAIMISAVFRVALTGSTQTSSRGDCQVAAAQAAQALLQRLKNYVAAIADFDEAIKLNPRYINAYANRAAARRAAGDKQGAAADDAKALELAAPSTPPRQ